MTSDGAFETFKAYWLVCVPPGLKPENIHLDDTFYFFFPYDSRNTRELRRIQRLAFLMEARSSF